MWTATRFSTQRCLLWSCCVVALLGGLSQTVHAALKAGTAKVDITNRDAGPVNDPLYVKALVVQDEVGAIAIITVDAVAIAEIGSIRNDYLATVRTALQRELGLPPERVLINASHCHGSVHSDVAARTIEAVKTAWKQLVPVKVGAGRGTESRVTENRRMLLKSGREADVRHAYSLPADDAVVSVGPIDPVIGLLRLDRYDGTTLAIVYNFACHPIQGVPGGGNTADMIAFSSAALETGFGHDCLALFLQGCGGDINPARYKDVSQPRDAEPLGQKLGLSALAAAKTIECRAEGPVVVVHQTLDLPRADHAERIALLESEQTRLVQSLKGTSLNFKTFLPLLVKYQLSPEFPSDPAHRYLSERLVGRDHLEKLDAENRRNLEAYLQNVLTMEELTRLQTNLALLKRHQARNVAAGKRTVEAEVLGLRIGDFKLVTFPGELTVQVGLKIKDAVGDKTAFVAGYTNGYLFYAGTTDQLRNTGAAQEDSDCLLDPDWHPQFEAHAIATLKRLIAP